MDFLINSLRPWNNAPVSRRKSTVLFGLPIERSYSSMSGVQQTSSTYVSEPYVDTVDEYISTPDRDVGFSIQRFPSVEQIFRLPSFECIRRMSSLEDIRRMASFESMAGFQAPKLEGMEDVCEAGVHDAGESDFENLDGTTIDQSVDASLSTPDETPCKARRRTRCDSVSSNQGAFEYLDESRPWESECIDSLNTIPEGFTPESKDYNISLGDLRVLARFHVQKKANAAGIKLPAGMTNSDLVSLADSLGLYPLVHRLHLEACGRIPTPQLHQLFLDYKRESKSRAKVNKAKRDLNLASVTRLTDDGKVTVDYFDGIALRLGRERDTIFRPLLHKVFREFKEQIRPKLAEAGLAYNEMRKWRDTQLCTALWVANHFVEGIWQAAVDVHLSKTKDFR
jgi:hypothetical protein